MLRKRGLTPSWGLVLVAYWALLIPTVLVVLTSQANVTVALPLLAVGVPIYFLAANAMVNHCAPAPDREDGANVERATAVVPFPGHPSAADIASAVHARAHHVRRLG